MGGSDGGSNLGLETCELVAWSPRAIAGDLNCVTPSNVLSSRRSHPQLGTVFLFLSFFGFNNNCNRRRVGPWQGLEFVSEEVVLAPCARGRIYEEEALAPHRG